MAQNIRQVQGGNTNQYDPSAIAGVEFNPAAGSQKVSEVGRSLLPLKYIAGGTTLTYTTDASTARILDAPGACLAVYNSTGTIGSITLGPPGATPPTVLAPGVANTTGQVGIPCAPNAWTYIACSANQWVIASASTLMVFLIEDNTAIKVENPYG
ncbi:unnamed protein product [Sphagnum balticum]